MPVRVPRYLGHDLKGQKVELPADASTQGFAILGKRGMGKSTLAADIIEEFAADGIPFVVFDPPGAHWGIRFAAGENGQPTGPSGFNVLLIGGDHADIPLEQTTAQDLARIIVETNLSCVIDLKAMSYTGLQKYYADFAEELFKINRTVRHLFFEEAQNVAPQNLKFDDQKRALYATEKLIDEGRGIGLGFTLVSQRPAAVNKSVLTQVDNLLSLGMFAPQDIDQVEDWFRHHVRGDKEKLREVMDDIAGMKRGECWLLSPGRAMLKFHVRNRVTYHAGRTPKPGERAVNVDKFSVTEAVKTLRALFSQKQVARKHEVQDLAEAKKRIRELEREVRSSPRQKLQPSTAKTEGIPPAQVQRLIGVSLDRQRRELIAWHRQRTIELWREMTTRIKVFADQLPQISGPEIQTKEHGSNKKLAEPTGLHLAAPKVPRNRPDSNNHLEAASGELSGPERRILRALGELLSIGKEAPPKAMVAAWSGYSPIGGAFGNPLGALRSRSLIAYSVPGQVALTEEGSAFAGPCDPPDREELIRRIEAICTGPERKILSVVMDQNGEEIAKNELAEKAGYSPVGGAFGNPLGALRTKGLIDYPRPGVVKAADWLAEVQRPDQTLTIFSSPLQSKSSS